MLFFHLTHENIVHPLYPKNVDSKIKYQKSVIMIWHLFIRIYKVTRSQQIVE